MDYPTVQQIMASKGLATDPAFDDLKIGIEPIHCYNSCPLGLYFPDTEWSSYIEETVPGKTIIIPPNALEATLLHELGHRHGHYYYNNLSEKYAEDFRRQYQKGGALLYLGNDFGILPKFGKLFEEGEKGAVEIALLQPLTPVELYDIRSQLPSYSPYGEPAPKVHYGNSEVPWLRVEFTKGADWMVIIGSVLAGTAIAGIGALAYAVYKTAEKTPWIVPVTLAGVGAALLLRAAIRQERVKARLPL